MKPALVIVGLGNHGKAYQRTRHNVGFVAVDALGKVFGEGDWERKQKFLSEIKEARILTFPVLLSKPHTYMNLSGDAVRKIVHFYGIDPRTQLLVISDDVDLPLGTIRLRKSGGPGTHNGLKSIVECFGERFPRLRIGIGPQPKEPDLSSWVLSTFTADETKTLEKVLEKLPDVVTRFLLEEEPPTEDSSESRS